MTPWAERQLAVMNQPGWGTPKDRQLCEGMVRLIDRHLSDENESETVLNLFWSAYLREEMYKSGRANMAPTRTEDLEYMFEIGIRAGAEGEARRRARRLNDVGPFARMWRALWKEDF